MIERLVEMYEKGAITAHHLALECLHRIDPAEPEAVLQCLPHDILVRIVDFARRYDPNGMVTNYGALPTADQVQAARDWIGHALPQMESRTIAK